MHRPITIAALLLSTAAAAQTLPPGAPPGTYNAATSTSGAFTGDDSLYAGNSGYFSRIIGTGGTIISYKRIVVTETSIFWGVTGNGTSASGEVLDSLDWEITVDPFDGSIATSNPSNGSIIDEILTLSDLIHRGPGFVGGTSEDLDVMLNPLDGESFVLEAGDYYVAVWTDSSPFSYSWLWTELSTIGVNSDIFYGSFRHAPGEFDPILGENTLAGQTMQTGDLAFDVWMTPVAPPCPGDIADDFGALNPDGQVTFGDFLALLGLVGPCPGMMPGCDGDIADDFGALNPDGQVSFGDFLALLGLVGPCP